MSNIMLKINEELNGIELYFNNKPERKILDYLKSNGYRFSNYKKCWYSKQSEKAFKIAEDLTNNNTNNINTTTDNSTHSSNKKQNTMSLWDATQWQEMNVNTDQEIKEIAKEIRQHIKKRFPQCKFSVRTGGSRLHSSIDFTIKSSPYEKDSKYLKAIQEYCSNLLNAYKYCVNYDPYGDYGSSYNFYGHVSIDWQYTKTDITEEIKKDMEHFDQKQLEQEKAEEERREREFQEWDEQRKLEAIDQQKKQEEEKKQIEHIYDSIDVKPLEEDRQYFIVGSEFANLNKNSTLEQYEEEVKNGDYVLQNVKVTKEVHFKNKEALTYFSNMLLYDFDFLTDTGGSYTDDNRINSMTDFYNMDEEEKESVQWNLYGVAIYYNNELQFVVDAQGYSYARYVGLTDSAIISKTLNNSQVIDGEELQKLKHEANIIESISTNVITELNMMDTWQNESWTQYKEEFKKQLKENKIKLNKGIIQQVKNEALKQSMYKLLIEVDGIQEQFKDADIQQGDKLTLFYISDWGSIVTSKIIFNSVEYTKYAQYDNAVRLIFTPEGKRKLHYKYFHYTLLVYKGWYSLPDTVLNHVKIKNNMIITQSKYHSCDMRQYDEILNYFQQQGLKPIINTYKPTF